MFDFTDGYASIVEIAAGSEVPPTTLRRIAVRDGWPWVPGSSTRRGGARGRRYRLAEVLASLNVDAGQAAW